MPQPWPKPSPPIRQSVLNENHRYLEEVVRPFLRAHGISERDFALLLDKLMGVDPEALNRQYVVDQLYQEIIPDEPPAY